MWRSKLHGISDTVDGDPGCGASLVGGFLAVIFLLLVFGKCCGGVQG